MKIYYVANNRLPDKRAYGVHISKMCEAFAKNGVDLTLVLPRRWNSVKEDLFSYYKVKKIFKIKKLPVFDLVFLKIPFVFFAIETITFCISLFFYFLFKKEKAIIYTRGEMVLFLTKFLPKRYSVFWETHIKPTNVKRYKNAFKNTKGLVVVNEYYQKELIEKYKLPKEKILLFPDGVDLEQFDIDISKEGSRRELNLPLDKKIIFYVGSDVEWKGLSVLKETSNFLPKEYQVILVGDIKKEEDKYPNIIFAGQKPNYEIPFWLKASDLAILTGTVKSEISSFYTSPLKMFEYMASKTPIIAADLESFREILNEENAFFYDSSNPKDLAEKIIFTLNNYGIAEEKARNAFEKAKKYGWIKRAESIIKFMNIK